jgi:hypothetical protein
MTSYVERWLQRYLPSKNNLYRRQRGCSHNSAGELLKYTSTARLRFRSTARDTARDRIASPLYWGGEAAIQDEQHARRTPQNCWGQNVSRLKMSQRSSEESRRTAGGIPFSSVPNLESHRMKQVENSNILSVVILGSIQQRPHLD